ncbi:hypothetical protein H0A71_13735 [Alcaligenaceae bacterium]|nr:hypothetical protein [Alcaligenaceae bacterium]
MKHLNTRNTLRSTTELLFAATLALGSASVIASPLIYTPVNPSFGGYAFNGPYLLSIAVQGASGGAPNPLDGLNLTGLTTMPTTPTTPTTPDLSGSGISGNGINGSGSGSGGSSGSSAAGAAQGR